MTYKYWILTQRHLHVANEPHGTCYQDVIHVQPPGHFYSWRIGNNEFNYVYLEEERVFWYYESFIALDFCYSSICHELGCALKVIRKMHKETISAKRLKPTDLIVSVRHV